MKQFLARRAALVEPILGGFGLTMATIGYLAVTAAAVIVDGVVAGMGQTFAIGVSAVLALYAAAFAVALAPRPGGFSLRAAIAVTGLAVAAQILTWLTAVLDHVDSVEAYQPLVVTAYVLYVMVIFRNHLVVAWCGAVLGSAVTVWVGPHTGSTQWWTALQTTSIVVLSVVTAAVLVIRPLLSEIDALATRYRGVAASGERESIRLAQREQRLQRIDQRVRPRLEHILATGAITDDDVTEARLIEARLRDGIRAPAFDSTPIREAVWRARENGVAVTLLDDGGLRERPEAETVAFLSSMIPLLCAELDALSSGELIARVAPPDRSPIATMTVVQHGTRRRVEFGVDGHVARVVHA